MDEPIYQFIKGEGWVAHLIKSLEGTNVWGRKFVVYARKPNPGELFMRRNSYDYGEQDAPDLWRFSRDIASYQRHNFRGWDTSDTLDYDKTIVTVVWL